MKLVRQNTNKLLNIKDLVGRLSAEEYVETHALVHGSSIGQHIRHILEFYQQLIVGLDNSEICYDHREREMQIETSIPFTVDRINEIIEHLGKISFDAGIDLKACYTQEDEAVVEVLKTSVKRELAYALDHTVHHLAIIKVMLNLGGISTDESFGVAASTIRHKKQTTYA